MNDRFRAMLNATLDEFRVWREGHNTLGCRWVQYTGVEMSGALDVPLDEVAHHLKNAVCEGYQVGWAEHNGKLYLRVWEGDDEPAWEKVFAEKSLADVSEILRRAGFPEA